MAATVCDYSQTQSERVLADSCIFLRFCDFFVVVRFCVGRAAVRGHGDCLRRSRILVV